MGWRFVPRVRSRRRTAASGRRAGILNAWRADQALTAFAFADPDARLGHAYREATAMPEARSRSRRDCGALVEARRVGTGSLVRIARR